MSRRSLARFVTALGLAVAVVLGTGGTAGAAPPPGADDRGAVDEREQPGPDPRVSNPGPVPADPIPDTAGGSDTPTADQAGPHAAAPTANLRTLANALVVQNRGIYLDITAPAGLGVGPVEISIGFGPERFTMNYNNTTGFDRVLGFQPLTGAPRMEYVNISLLERVAGGPYSYAISSQVNVVPQYTITMSDVFVDADVNGGTCDLTDSADPTVFWVDPEGVQHREDIYDMNAAEDFGGSWTEVDVHRGLTKPTLEWVDRDPGGFGSVGENALPRGPELLPFSVSYPDRNSVVEHVVETLPDAGGDGCSARLSYSITYTPTAYVR